jgi:hypothetical protein
MSSFAGESEVDIVRSNERYRWASVWQLNLKRNTGTVDAVVTKKNRAPVLGARSYYSVK